MKRLELASTGTARPMLGNLNKMVYQINLTYEYL